LHECSAAMKAAAFETESQEANTDESRQFNEFH
jgi:hypothetical protein